MVERKTQLILVVLFINGIALHTDHGGPALAPPWAHTTSCLPGHGPVDTWAVSTFRRPGTLAAAYILSQDVQ